MPILKRTIVLNIDGDTKKAVDEKTGLECVDAGVEGEDCAVALKAKLPETWSDLAARISVTASDGSFELSGLAENGEILMPLTSRVTVPGRLSVSLIGSSQEGIKRTLCIDTLLISAAALPSDIVKERYPIAFNKLENEIKTKVVKSITGSGAALITKTGDTSYNIAVTGCGGDMLTANYANGSASANKNAVDRALYADTAANVKAAQTAEKATTASFAENFVSGSPLEKTILSKQNKLTSGGSGEEILSADTIKSIDAVGIDVSSDDSTVFLTLPGSVTQTGMIAFSAVSVLPAGFLFANGNELKIADYLPLYSKIGTRFGKGRRSYVEVSVSCLSNNRVEAENIIAMKYTNSIVDSSFFADGGTLLTSKTLRLYEPGSYTFYCRDANGNEALQYVYIPPLTDEFLLALSQEPDPANAKNTVTECSVESENDITLVKLAGGIRTADYFLSAGNEIGSCDETQAVFSDGSTLGGGVYTFYAKSASASQIQYINVTTEKKLSMYLGVSFGSDYFKLPDLYGKLGEGIIPMIRS